MNMIFNSQAVKIDFDSIESNKSKLDQKKKKGK